MVGVLVGAAVGVPREARVGPGAVLGGGSTDRDRLIEEALRWRGAGTGGNGKVSAVIFQICLLAGKRIAPRLVIGRV